MIGESGRSVGPDGHGSGGLQGGRLSLNGRICEKSFLKGFTQFGHALNMKVVGNCDPKFFSDKLS